jgi:hypothetical protein
VKRVGENTFTGFAATAARLQVLLSAYFLFKLSSTNAFTAHMG